MDGPLKGVRLDQLQLSWVEGYGLTYGLSFSGVVRLAISRLMQEEFKQMDQLGNLFEILDMQSRKLEAAYLESLNPTSDAVIADQERTIPKTPTRTLP